MAPPVYPLKYIGAGLVIYICFGTIYAWSVFRGPLEEALAIGAGESGLPYMLFLASWAMTMPLGGVFIKRAGPRLAVIIGGSIVSIGWILSSYATDIVFLSVTYGLVGGIGVGLAYGAPLAVSAAWLPLNKGLAIGGTLAGIGLSPFFTAPLATWLIESYGILLSFRYLGLGFLLIIPSLALILRFPKLEEVAQAKMESPGSRYNLGVGQMIRTKEFIGLWLCFAIGTVAGLTAIGIATPMGQEVVRLDSRVATLLVSVFALFNAIGRPIFGTVADRVGTIFAIIVSYLLIIFASVLAIFSGGGGLYFFAVSFSLLWLVLGGWLAIAPAATTKLFGATNYTENYGFVFTAYGVGAIAGGLLSGWFKDVWGSYTFTFYPILVLAILGIFIALFTLQGPRVKCKIYIKKKAGGKHQLFLKTFS